jgi:hypothetical protein
LKAKPDCAPITVAIDLGPERSGVAVKERRYETAGQRRYGFVVVAASTMANGEVVEHLKAARPRYVLVEKAAEGYRQAEARRALAQVEAACGDGQTLCVASYSQWTAEAFGSSRTLQGVVDDRAMAVLGRWLGDEEAGHVWYSTAGNAHRNARSALILLACWEPKQVLLARGRWGPKVVLSKRTHGKSCVCHGVAAGAARLYQMLWLAGSLRVRPGRALLCQAAGVSTKSYKAYLKELELADVLQVQWYGKNPAVIVL